MRKQATAGSLLLICVALCLAHESAAADRNMLQLQPAMLQQQSSSVIQPAATRLMSNHTRQLQDFVGLVYALYKTAYPPARLQTTALPSPGQGKLVENSLDKAAGLQNLNQVGAGSITGATNMITTTEVQLIEELMKPTPVTCLRKLKAMWPMVTLVQPMSLTVAAALAFQKPIPIGLMFEHVARGFMMIKLKSKLFVLQDKGAEEDQIRIYEKWLRKAFPKLNFLAMIIETNVLESKWKRQLYGMMPLNKLAIVSAVSKLYGLYLDQVTLYESKGKIKKVTLSADKKALVEQQIMILDIKQKLNFVICLLILKLNKFAWDIWMPAAFRMHTLKARWRVAMNRQQLYTLHKELLKDSEENSAMLSAERSQKVIKATKALNKLSAKDKEELLGAVSADAEREEEEKPEEGDEDSNAAPEPAQARDEEEEEEDDSNEGDLETNKEDDNDSDTKERPEEEEEPAAAPVQRKAPAQKKVPVMKKTPQQKKADATIFLDTFEQAGLEAQGQFMTMPDPSFLQMHGFHGRREQEQPPASSFLQVSAAPPFSKWAQDPKLGSQILGVDEQSFDPTTSGQGPPPDLPNDIDAAEDAIVHVQKAAGASMQAYLDYGLSPYITVTQNVLLQGDMITALKGVSLRLAYMGVDTKEKVYEKKEEVTRAHLNAIRSKWFASLMIRVLNHVLNKFSQGELARLQAIKDSSALVKKAVEGGDRKKDALLRRTIFFKLFPDYYAWIHSRLHVEIGVTVTAQRVVELSRQQFEMSYSTFLRTWKAMGASILGQRNLAETTSFIQGIPATTSAALPCIGADLGADDDFASFSDEMDV